MQISTAAELSREIGGKRSGDRYSAKCPSHEDNHESLSFADGDKAILFTCHTGCSRDSVIGQLFWVHDVEIVSRDTSPKSDKPSIVREYDYQDADGTFLYQKVRFEPKDFRIRRKEGDGWVWSMKGVKEVLYCLPAVRRAIESGETVYVVEGEKDVDALIYNGLIATCNTHGASKDAAKPKWTSHHAMMLQGAKEVIIFADNDDAGKAHAKAVAESLPYKEMSVKIVDLPGLPAKGDVSDWLGYGGTKEQLLELVAKAPRYGTESSQVLDFTPRTVRELMSQNFEPPRWAIEDLLPEGLTILAGAPKIGKSWLSLDIAVAVSRGEKVLGDYDTCQGDVLYLALEDSDRRLQRRLGMIAEEDKTADNGALFYHTKIPGMAAGGLTALSDWLKAHPNCRMVIIDTLARFIPPSERGVNAYQADYAVVAKLQDLAMEHHVALVAVHHVRKAKSNGDVFDGISGSSGITGPADANWILTRPRTESTGKLTVTGRDIEEMEFTAEFNKDNCRWTLEGDARQGARRKNLVALVAAFNDKPFTFESAKTPLGVQLRQSKNLVNSLLSEGYVTRLEEKLGKAYQFKLTDKMTDRILGGTTLERKKISIPPRGGE